jgi:VWFA-related protein
MRKLILLIFVVCLSAGSSLLHAQTNREREFGSSLKRLKWDPEKKAAIDETKQSQKKVAEVDEGDVIKFDSTLVVCDLLVANKSGAAIPGLSKNDFVITDDGVSQEVATFNLGDDPNKSRSIVLIIDHSGSQAPYLNRSIAAAKTLVDQLRPNDRMAIVSDDVSLVRDFTANKKDLKRSLDWLENKGETGNYGLSRQYSALMATLMDLVGSQERPIIIFQTDGDELGSLRTRDVVAKPGSVREFGLVDLVNAAERARVTIYTVIPGLQIVGLPPEEQLKRAKVVASRGVASWIPVERFEGLIRGYIREQTALEGLSKLSGGWTEFLEKPEQADAIYSRILADINHRYVLGFQPTNKDRDGKRRKLSIEVRNHPEYIVWGRKFYYAPAN